MILHINSSEYDYHTLVKVAEMVRLRKNNKAGNPHKHYIFCRTSLFRLRSYKDNFHTKTIKQAIF